MTSDNLSPQEAWDLLMAGNQRFSTDSSRHPHLEEARRSELTGGQHPLAVVVACSDSRVPVEIIFDAGLGDIFVVRTAGQILGEAVMGSVSYAINSLEVPLVIVLGHESCGAVAAAVDAVSDGQVPDDHRRVLVERVTPTILTAQKKGASTSDDFEKHHAHVTASQLIQRMPSLTRRIKSGSVAMVAARYLLGSGEVEVVSHRGELEL